MSFFHSFDLLKSLKLTPKALYQAFSLVHSRNISVTVAVPGTHPGGEIVVLVALLQVSGFAKQGPFWGFWPVLFCFGAGLWCCGVFFLCGCLYYL